MGVSNFNDLRAHIGHKLVCVIYGEENVAIECETCNEVLLDFTDGEDCARMRTSCECDNHKNGENAESFQANDAVEEVVSDGE